MTVRKVPGGFAVFSLSGRRLGKHRTRAGALRQLGAIEAAKARRRL